GRTILDPKSGEDPKSVARTVLTQALARLQKPTAVQARAALDQRRRTQATQGTLLKITKEMGLMKRYEAMHARRRREAWAELLQIRQATGNPLPAVKEKRAARKEKERQERRPERQPRPEVSDLLSGLAEVSEALRKSAPAAAASASRGQASKSQPGP